MWIHKCENEGFVIRTDNFVKSGDGFEIEEMCWFFKGKKEAEEFAIEIIKQETNDYVNRCKDEIEEARKLIYGSL